MRSFGYAFEGLALIVRTQPNFWVHVTAACAALVLGMVLSVVWLIIIGAAYILQPEPRFRFSDADITKVPEHELLAAVASVRAQQLAFLAAGLGIPTTTFALGWGLLWALRGFRRVTSGPDL